MVYIRTDADELVATGHIMRCITVSEQLQALGEQTMFLISNRVSSEFLPQDWHFVRLEKYADVFREIPEIQGVIAANGPGKLVLDSYAFSAKYMQAVRKSAEKIITFDDMFFEKFPVDMLINYNLYYERFDYAKRYRGSGTKLLLGGNYVPIRKQFLGVSPHKPKEVRHILLICGGGDRYNFLITIIREICKAKLYEKYHFTVISGVLNPNAATLEEYGQKYSGIEVLRNVHDMVHVLQNADVIVSAASTVLYECCCVGVPTIFFTTADNQKYDRDVFSQDGIMLYAGDFRYESKAVIRHVFSMIEQLAADRKRRINMANMMKSKIDCNGAKRIAQEILAL